MTGRIKTTLGELCLVTMGQSPPSSTYNTDKKGLPFFQGKAEFSDLYPVPQKWCSKPKKEAENGSILISVRAPVGDVNIANQRCCIGRGLAAIKYDACPRFIFYFLKYSKSEFEKLSTGTTFKAISKQTILNYSLFIPSLDLQHHIVAKIEELFSELDNGIESLKKVREQLKTYRQAVLKYAFEGKLTKKWRTLQRRAGTPPEPAEKLLEQIKTEREKHYQKQLEDWKRTCEQAKTEGKKKPTKPRKPKELPPLTEKDLAKLPEGWKWEQIEGITTVLGDGLHGTPIYSDEGEYYFINGNNLSDGKIEIKENTKRVTIKEYRKYKKPLNENTVLVSINGTLGNTAFYNGEKVILGKSACYFNVVNSIDKFYIRYWITSQRFISYAYKNATGSTIKNVSLKAMRKFEIPIPQTLEEQKTIVQEIESRLSVCDKLEQTVEDSLKKAEALRQSILKKAFAGELTRDWREKHPELIAGENSAEKLLERIKAEKVLADARKNLRKSKRKKKK